MCAIGMCACMYIQAHICTYVHIARKLVNLRHRKGDDYQKHGLF